MILTLIWVIHTWTKKNYDKAEMYYTKAINCQPENFKIYYQLGFLHLKKNELKKARDFFL